MGQDASAPAQLLDARAAVQFTGNASFCKPARSVVGTGVRGRFSLAPKAPGYCVVCVSSTVKIRGARVACLIVLAL